MKHETAVSVERFALNRIACPSLDLDGFYALAAKAGLRAVELRNDLPGGQVVDGLAPARAVEAAEKHGVRVVTINALQKFDLAAERPRAMEELERLLDLAAAIRCPAIVLCPTNDTGDRRSPEARREETVGALRAFAPAFSSRGLLGYVEPLGFEECALRSAVGAAAAVRSSGASCYRIVLDTFHHYLGPDGMEDLGSAYDVSMTGLVHVSGVEAPLPKEQLRDPHRILPGPRDRMDSRGQIARLLARGYRGDISFEPFSPEVQRTGPEALVAALRASVEHLAA